MLRPWLAFICAEYGHVQMGSGTGTDSVVWQQFCQRCGADLLRAPSSFPSHPLPESK